MSKNTKSKILVIGCSRFGSLVASKASLEGHFVTIIDLYGESFIKLDPSYSGYTIEGDATEMYILEKAKINEMDEVTIATEDDDTNIFIADAIGHFYPNVSKIIVRLNDDNKSILLQSKKVSVVSPTDLSMKQYNKVKEDK